MFVNGWLVQLNSEQFVQNLPEPIKIQIMILGTILLVLWGLELVDTILLRGALNQLGIYPRQLRGIPGILFAPLLHGNLGHLAANTGPLMVLGWLILAQGINLFLIVTAVSWLVSGLGAWLLGGSKTNHLGASGIVFGYFGFLLLRGYFERSVGSIVLAALVGIFYGGMIWGVLPISRGKSWQSHAFGFLGGGLAARFLPMLQAHLEQML
jgi:membrane associated rhomboid family serine protease